MGRFNADPGERKKISRAVDRDTSTALILLRALQLGLNLSDLELITLGMLYDIMIEKENDSVEYDEIATAEDIANF